MKPNRPKALSIGNEYGFYDDIDDNHSIHQQRSEAMKDKPETKDPINPGTSNRLKLSLQMPNPCTVICKVEDNPSPVAIRSFATTNPQLYTGTTAHISIAALQIVQDDLGEDAEYQVKLSLNSSVYLVWKRYSDFEELGDAFDEYSGFGLIIHKTKRLQKSIDAWHKVKAHRPWLMKDLSLKFLREESLLLEVFMSNLLFEAPNVELLKEFVL